MTQYDDIVKNDPLNRVCVDCSDISNLQLLSQLPMFDHEELPIEDELHVMYTCDSYKLERLKIPTNIWNSLQNLSMSTTDNNAIRFLARFLVAVWKKRFPSKGKD